MYTTKTTITIKWNIPQKQELTKYQRHRGDKVRERGPFLYGYSMSAGPDGKSKVREFGDVRSPSSSVNKEAFLPDHLSLA